MLKQNVVANFLGSVWPSLLGLILVPVYLKYLGVEAYGLVGFFVSLQALISFLDLGLSTTTNREVAFGLSAPGQKVKTRDFIRTLEIVYGLIALLIALGFFLAADWLAREWINAQELSIETVRLAVVVFGVTLALRWPVALYTGVLYGSEKQVLYNTLYVMVSTVRSVGAALVVAFVSHTILGYLIWQLISALTELGVMAFAAWKILHVEPRHFPHPRFFHLQQVWKFSAAVGANSLLAAWIKQMDRILISKLLLLQQVGYYTTANTAYSAISLFVSPLASAAFPRFTALIAEKNEVELAAAYHKTSQYVSFIVAPVSASMMFFSHDILLLWTRSEDVAVNAAPTLSILALAALFNSMMQMPFVLQLSAGITWISLWNNAINLVLLAPLMYYLISHYGVAGAGIAWLVFNVLYYLIVPHVLHHYVLPSEKLNWIFRDTLPFMVASLFIYGAAYWFRVSMEGAFFFVPAIILGSVLYAVFCVISYPMLRAFMKELLLNTLFILKVRRIRTEKT